MTDTSCIFCKIAKQQVSSMIVYEDEYILAFKDTAPQAPVHIILIPKIHISGLNKLTDSSSSIVAHIIITATRLAKENGIDISGYRLLTNCGPDAGQSVHHLHFHLLGGALMLNSLA
jgi:histidine triad (HIT) family protein